MIDISDVPDDDNVCTIDSCDPTFGTKKHEPSQNGIACTDAAPGYCFQGYCMDDCAPMNPSSCGGEGADRPTNDSGTTATDFQYPVMCGFLANGDVDWYEFHAIDEDFSYDVLQFYVWSQASQVQVCAYVKCDDGTAPGGGCSSKTAGPNGSQGCCWTGSGATFHQSWDLDCGSNEDSGQVYVKVNSTGLLPPPDACDQYSVQMYY